MNSDILLAYLESALRYFLSLILIQFHKITFLFKKQLILKQPIPRHLLFPVNSGHIPETSEKKSVKLLPCFPACLSWGINFPVS